jgi:AmmeMemoRadiSam system protein A
MNKELLLDIAKKSIEKKFNTNVEIDKKKILEDNQYLQENGATFVTLTLNGQLRGCIGSLQAYRPLLDDLIGNSYSAAFNDPRFYELTLEEFKKVNIEISILTTPIEVIYKDLEDLKSKLKPNIHGVILQGYGRRSTFLPQVWEQLPAFEDFFAHLCNKGGFEVDLDFHPQVFTYEVEKIK